MLSNLDTLRAATRLATTRSSLHPVDDDLAAEAGMDGNLARLLQAARDLDREATMSLDGEEPTLVSTDKPELRDF